jgi:hypothetical protein
MAQETDQTPAPSNPRGKTDGNAPTAPKLPPPTLPHIFVETGLGNGEVDKKP